MLPIRRTVVRPSQPKKKRVKKSTGPSKMDLLMALKSMETAEDDKELVKLREKMDRDEELVAQFLRRPGFVRLERQRDKSREKYYGERTRRINARMSKVRAVRRALLMRGTTKAVVRMVQQLEKELR